jgi:hypothetical protein
LDISQKHVKQKGTSTVKALVVTLTLIIALFPCINIVSSSSHKHLLAPQPVDNFISAHVTRLGAYGVNGNIWHSVPASILPSSHKRLLAPQPADNSISAHVTRLGAFGANNICHTSAHKRPRVIAAAATSIIDASIQPTSVSITSNRVFGSAKAANQSTEIVAYKQLGRMNVLCSHCGAMHWVEVIYFSL